MNKQSCPACPPDSMYAKTGASYVTKNTMLNELDGLMNSTLKN